MWAAKDSESLIYPQAKLLNYILFYFFKLSLYADFEFRFCREVHSAALTVVEITQHTNMLWSFGK